MRAKKVTWIGKDKLFQDRRHILITGQTGKGKSAFLETLCFDRWYSGAKVIIFSLKSETCQLGFPERNKNMCNLIRNKHFKLPRPYPHQVLQPFIVSAFNQVKNNTMQVELPKHSDYFVNFQKQMRDEGRHYGWSNWEPFKLSFKQMKAEDLLVLLQNATPAASTVLEMLFKSKDFASLDVIIRNLISLVAKEGNELRIGTDKTDFEASIGKKETFAGLLRLLSNIQKSGFLCGEKNGFKLDLAKLMDDTEQITTINLADCDSAFSFLIFTAIMRRIIELRIRKEFPPLFLCIPEAANFAPAKKSISPFAVGGFSALTIMQTLSRESRLLGCTLCCDTQRAEDLNRTFLSNFGWLVASRLNKNEAQWLNDNFCYIQPNVRKKIPYLETGRFFIQSLGSDAYSYPFIACPPVAYHRKAGQDVLEWIYQQPFVEKISYADKLKETLQVRIAPVAKKRKERMRISNKKEQQIIELGKEGASIYRVAKEVGINKQTAKKYLLKYELWSKNKK